MHGPVSAHPRASSLGFLDDAVIDEMAAAEESHWWYLGLQDLLARIVTSRRFGVRRGGSVLDAGCGTGANLRLLRDVLEPAHLEGFDAHPLSIRTAAKKCPSADVYLGDIREPRPHRDEYDLVLSCDVVSLVGRQACRGGLRRLVERLAPEGRFVLHLPACRRLFARHDEAVGNIERYARDEVDSLLRSIGLEIELLTYRMCLTFPAVAAYRKWGGRRGDEPLRSDLSRGPAFLSPLLRTIIAVENRFTVRSLRWPIGSSIVAVGRRIR